MPPKATPARQSLPATDPSPPEPPYAAAPSFAYPKGTAFVAVEYPGYVKNIDKALETLGGKERVGRVASGVAPFLELRFRPSDPFSHPIVGDAIETSNLLLKVTRRRRRARDREPPGEWTERAELLGEIVRTVRFRQMADFQYVPDPTWNSTQLGKAVADLDVDSMFALLAETDDGQDGELRNIPPPIFSRIDVPQDYGFRQNPAVVKVADANVPGGYKLVNRQKAARLVAHFFDPHSQTVPSAPPAQTTTDLAKLNPAHVETLRTLFATRPIWSRLAILNSLPAEARKQIKKLLPVAAYFVSSGPFRESWVRYGYDFRKEAEARAYQTVDVRFVKEAKPLARAKRLLEGKAVASVLKHQNTVSADDPESHLFDGHQAKQMTIYQLADITFPPLRALIETAEGDLLQYNDKEGWMTRKKLDTIREALRVEYLRLANRVDERPRKLAEGEKRVRKKKVLESEEDQEGEGEAEAPVKKKRGRPRKTPEEKSKGAAQSKTTPRGVKPRVLRDNRRELNTKVAALMAGLNLSSLGGPAGKPASDEAEPAIGDSDAEEGNEIDRGSGSDEEESSEMEAEGEIEGPDEEEEDFYDDIFGGAGDD